MKNRLAAVLATLGLALTLLAGPAAAWAAGTLDVSMSSPAYATQPVTATVTVDAPSDTTITFQAYTEGTPRTAWVGYAEDRAVPAGTSTQTFTFVPPLPGDHFAAVASFTDQSISDYGGGVQPFTVAGVPSAVTATPAHGKKVAVGATGETITGRATPAGVHTVTLDLDTANGWVPIASTTSDAAGNYSIKVPTDVVYSGTLRVGLARNGPYAGAAGDATFPMTVKRTYRPRGTSDDYRITGHLRWDPCHVIGYRVNTTGAPKGALTMVRKALKMVREATGLRFAYRGSTSLIPYNESSKDPDSPLLIGWATPKQVPALGGGTLGWGGGTGGGAQFNGFWAFENGDATLDSTAHLKKGFGAGATWGSLLLHEIGHAVGLNHARGLDQQMVSGLRRTAGVARYGAGDLAGLRKVGATQGCFPATAYSSGARLANTRVRVVSE